MKAIFIGLDHRVAEIAALSLRLRWPDFTLLVINTATEGVERIGQTSLDIVLLHPDFTDMSPFGAIERIRRFSSVPLMVLGCDADEVDMISSLDTGADSYVRLPCDSAEIGAIIFALLRRANGEINDGNETFLSGQLFINPATYEVFLAGQRVMLSPTEFRLLRLLIRNRGTMVSHQTLERFVGRDHSSGLVKKYMQRLRRKLGDDARNPRWIATVYGVGYRFIGPSPSTDFSDQTGGLTA